MKVKISNKELWKEYYTKLSVVSTIASLVFLFACIPTGMEWCGLLSLCFIAILLFLCIWIRANILAEISLNINNTRLEIKTGDIFTEDGFKIIAFNEFYDTQVDDNLISKQTLNGKYISQYCHQPKTLDAIIESDIHAQEQIAEICERTSGKRKRYKLGTIVKNEDFFLVAFSRFDKDNRAFLEVGDYVSCLMNMWNECDIRYGGNTIVLPLLGSGITRFHGYESITDQELLEILLWTIKTSNIRFKDTAKVKVILTRRSLSKISLYDIRTRFNS